MLNKLKLNQIPYWAIAFSLVLLPLGWNSSALAEPEEPPENTTKFERFCVEFPHNSVCKNKENYLSLPIWKKNKTVCSLATEWSNETKKCRLVVDGDRITIYVEAGLVAEEFSETLATQIMTIDLDEIFAFDTQWWLANVERKRSKYSKYGNRSASQGHTSNAVGTFTDLRIGFIPSDRQSTPGKVKFFTVSAKNLHQILEKMETWRYYLPDLAPIKPKLTAKSNNPASAANVADNLAKLEATNECPGCDLRNADLTDLDLEYANLQGANLAGANLTDTKLKRAYLLGADLAGANLVKSNLENANLMFATLKKTDLSEANLKGANLQNANLSNANLSKAKLSSSRLVADYLNLQVTSLKNANLTGANLTEADLKCVNFESANLARANLTDADLSMCEETSSTLTSADLSNIRLNGAGVPYTVADDVFNAVNLAANIATIAKNITNPALNSRSIGNLLLSNLTSTSIEYYLPTNLSGANLNHANLTGADLREAHLTDANLSKVILLDTKFKNNLLSNTNFIATDLKEIEFDNPIQICYATFSDESIYEEYCQPEAEE